MKTIEQVKADMIAALSFLWVMHGKIPEGRTDVDFSEQQVRVFGPSPVQTGVVVQLVAEGRGYSARVNPSGELGKLGFFNP